jgi:hypothetical protein
MLIPAKVRVKRLAGELLVARRYDVTPASRRRSTETPPIKAPNAAGVKHHLRDCQHHPAQDTTSRAAAC